MHSCLPASVYLRLQICTSVMYVMPAVQPPGLVTKEKTLFSLFSWYTSLMDCNAMTIAQGSKFDCLINFILTITQFGPVHLKWCMYKRKWLPRFLKNFCADLLKSAAFTTALLLSSISYCGTKKSTLKCVDIAMDSLLQGRHFQPCCVLYLICCIQNLLSSILFWYVWNNAHYLDCKVSLIPDWNMKTNKQNSGLS